MKENSSEKEPFILHPEHLEISKIIVKDHITKRYLKKGCKNCNLTGIKYINPKTNVLYPCPHCVNLKPAYEAWRKYCSHYPELKKEYCDV